jgi:hypothetical protein
MPIPELIVGVRSLPQGYEFHFSDVTTRDRALCGAEVEPTQIPPNFYGIDSAIEGRWCERCEALRKAAKHDATTTETLPGDAPCV